MKVGSLFSGIGGFDEGLRRAGMHTAWLCEIDKAAQSVLYRHFPDALLYDDVTTLGGDIERPDIIVGGFPCQDLSVAGRRAGLAGECSGLWYQFYRILGELTPCWVLIENVPGLLSSQDGRDFAIILSGLVKLRYGIAWRILDAQYFGVAQRRRRVFIVGCLGDRSRAAQVLFEPESLPGNPAPSREARKAVTALTSCGVGSCGADDNQAQAGHLISRKLAFGEYTQDSVSSSLTPCDFPGNPDLIVTHSLSAEGFDASEDGTGRGCPLTVVTDWDLVPTMAAQGDSSKWGVRAPDGLARQGTAVRRLTLTECERLQGFPDGWTDGQSDSARYRQLGNAVCVPVAEWIGRRIMESWAAGGVTQARKGGGNGNGSKGKAAVMSGPVKRARPL